jgi:hypothetical protein
MKVMVSEGRRGTEEEKEKRRERKRKRGEEEGEGEKEEREQEGEGEKERAGGSTNHRWSPRRSSQIFIKVILYKREEKRDNVRG